MVCSQRRKAARMNANTFITEEMQRDRGIQRAHRGELQC